MIKLDNITEGQNVIQTISTDLIFDPNTSSGEDSEVPSNP